MDRRRAIAGRAETGFKCQKAKATTNVRIIIISSGVISLADHAVAADSVVEGEADKVGH